MKFIKLVRYDLRHGLLKRWKWYVGAALMAIAFWLLFCTKVASYNRGAMITGDGPAITPSFGDTVFFVFAGMSEYVPDPHQSFSFPLIWMLLYLVLFWMTLEYAHNDLTKTGQQFLIRTNGRMLWWLSKCVWNFCAVLLFFAVIWLTLFVLCLLSGSPISLTLHAPLLEFTVPAAVSGPGYVAPLLFSVFCLAPLVLFALSMLQMALTLWLKPIGSFLVSVVILVASAYKLSPLLLGNYAMPVRNVLYNGTGVTNAAGVLLSAAVIAAAVLFGAVRFRKYDVLPIEE